MATTVNIALVTRVGVGDATFVTPNGDFVVPDNDGNVIVEVFNGGGSPVNVTFNATATVVGLAVASLTVSVGAGATRWIGPLPPAVFNNADDAVAGSAGTGLQMRGLRI